MAISKESLYGKLGVDSQKVEVHAAVKGSRIKELYPGSFCKILPDINGDPEYATIQHQDGAGSKPLQAYIHYKETGNPDWFRGTAYDTIAMNLDDILCVGVTDPIIFTDVIDRNPERIGGDVLIALIDEFNKACVKLQNMNVPIHFAGGETADLGDQVMTLTVNGASTARFKRSNIIAGHKINEGHIIVGIQGDGHAKFEEKPNSGMGSNGLTMARHTLMHSDYGKKYPETVEPRKLKENLAYFGKYKFDDEIEELNMGMTVGEAILSPTRTYAPIVYEILNDNRHLISGIVHNTGGGQTKCLHVGKKMHYIKDDLFSAPPIFKLIQQESKEDWKYMYQTFNCGNRIEIFCEPEALDPIINVTRKYGLEAKQIGHCEKNTGSGVKLSIRSEYGEFKYGAW